MEFKGTKGKWALDNGDSNGIIDSTKAFSIVSSEWAIAAVWKDIEDIEDIEEAEANANLIAAAPELLEALIEVLPHLGHYTDLHVSVQKKYLKAEKAINKALK